MILKKIAAFLMLTTCCFSKYNFAQTPKQILQRINTVRSDNRHFLFEIPFEYRNDHIIIKVKIGAVLYDYVFDTGGYNDITDGIQQLNNFKVLTTQTVGSANRLKSKVNIVNVDSLSIGGLVFKDLAALQMNFDGVPSMCGINGALIGASVIKNYCWQINFSKMKMTVTDDFSKLPLSLDALKIPVTFNNRLMPYIEATVNGKTDKYMFDLGSAGLFSMTEKTAKKYISGKKLTQLHGAAAEGGNVL